MADKKKIIDLKIEARRFMNQYKVVTDKQSDRVCLFDGRLYVELDDIEFKKLVSSYIKGKYSSLCWKINTIKELCELIRIEAEHVDDFNEKSGFMVMQNCIYNTKTRKEYPFNARLHMTAGLDFKHDAKATAPITEKFLRDVSCNNLLMVEDLKSLLGVALFGAADKLQRGIILLGEGSNGKSTFISLVSKLIPKGYITHLPISELTSARMFSKTSLRFSRANFVHEMPLSIDINELITKDIKAIITNDPISGEYKYGKQFSFRSRALLVFAGNTTLGVSEIPPQAVLRRISLFHFDAVFSGQNQDKDILSKMKRELPGIFNLAEQGLETLKQNNYRFQTQDKTDVELQMLISTSCPIDYFVQNAFEVDPSARIQNTKIVGAYYAWAKNQGIFYDEPSEKVGVPERLAHAIKKYYPSVKTDRGFSRGSRGKIGIRLKDEYNV